MSNVLKASQPINPGFDNNTMYNNPITAGDQKVHNIVDPSKVVRPDGKTERENERFQFNTNSNFEGFVKMLKDVPQMSELLSRLLIYDAKSMVTSGLSEDFAAQIAQFMEMMKMDEGQLLSFMKDQLIDSSQLGGVFFQALNDVLNQTRSVELKTNILDFIKKYNDLASSSHLLENIKIEAKTMLSHIFRSDAEELSEILSRLSKPGGGSLFEKGAEFLDTMGMDFRNNSRILKEELLPFFGRYINKTHDMGQVRGLITLITLNVSRYVNGDPENVLRSFEKLLSFQDFSQKFNGLTKDNMVLILNNLLEQKRMGESSVWTEKFLNIVRSGIQGEGGYEAKAVFQNVMNAMLLNESVYMPLFHLMLPVELNGNTMFSELWVDPDAERDRQQSTGDRTVRVLVKFDIKDLGYFDVIMDYRDGNVDLQVYYPERLSALEREIKNSLGEIVSRNGLSARNLVVGKNIKPVQLMDVFPKIAEGRNSVNVRV